MSNYIFHSYVCLGKEIPISKQKELVMDASHNNIETVEDYERIFERYLNVCNLALEKNKDRFPYKEIWKAQVKSLGQHLSIIHV